MQAEQSAGTPNQLTAAQRRRGLITLLTDVICMNTGFFMVIPLISVHYVDGLGWAATSIGLALALRQLVQQGFTLIGGMVADQIGVKQLICMGLVIRIIGFGLMAWASSLPILLLSTILAGLGGAMFEAPRLAAVAALTLPEERQRYYSLSGALAGIGMALGPFLGSLLLHIDFATVALVGAGCFTLNLIQMLIMLPQVRVATNPGSLGHGLKLVWHDRVFVFYTLLMMGYWFMWVQISISVPLLVMRITDSSDTIGIVYTINAFTAVVLQYPLIRLMARFMRPMLALILGVGLMTLAMGSAIIANAGECGDVLVGLSARAAAPANGLCIAGEPRRARLLLRLRLTGARYRRWHWELQWRPARRSGQANRCARAALDHFLHHRQHLHYRADSARPHARATSRDTISYRTIRVSTLTRACIKIAPQGVSTSRSLTIAR
jgi:DHA1 family multidrug resistance protein-like MFS transporter